MQAKQARIQFPAKMKPFAKPARYKVAVGGRASSKSWTIAAMLLLKGAEQPHRILCTREIQKSISASVLQLLADQIDRLGLSHFYTIQANKIIGANGTIFLFEGLRANVTKIKSMEGISICWAEEAEKITSESWQTLIPTIRKADSEIWISFNPDLETDPTYQRFIVNTPDDTVIVRINYTDNPFLPAEAANEAEYLKRVDYDAYANVWLGECRKSSDAEILRGKWVVDEFDDEIEGASTYYGADWGFSVDPTALIRMMIVDKTLYISHEFYKVGVEMDHLPGGFDTIPGARDYKIRADNARPETISYIKRQGFKIEAAKKWKGSIEDGIAFLRQFEKIVIHPRCVNTIFEARNWHYKTDKLTGDVLPDVVDKHNHAMDAIRYGLEPLISRPTKRAAIW